MDVGDQTKQQHAHTYNAAQQYEQHQGAQRRTQVCLHACQRTRHLTSIHGIFKHTRQDQSTTIGSHTHSRRSYPFVVGQVCLLLLADSISLTVFDRLC